MSNLNQEQIEQLFNLVGQVAPDNPTSEEISEILIKIENLLINRP